MLGIIPINHMWTNRLVGWAMGSENTFQERGYSRRSVKFFNGKKLKIDKVTILGRLGY